MRRAALALAAIGAVTLVPLAVSGDPKAGAATAAEAARASSPRTPTRAMRQQDAKKAVAALAAQLGCTDAKVKPGRSTDVVANASTRCKVAGLTVEQAAQVMADQGVWFVDPPKTNPDSAAWAIQALADPSIGGGSNDTYSLLWTNDDGGTLFIEVNGSLSPYDAVDGWTPIASTPSSIATEQ